MKYILDFNDIAQAIADYVAVKYNHPTETKFKIKLSMEGTNDKPNCSAIVKIKK